MTSFLISSTIFRSYWAIRHTETFLILATLRIERPNNFQTPKTLLEHRTGGAACLGIQFLASFAPVLIQSLALLGKLCLASSFAVVYIHSGEIFPTTVRNSGMGLVSRIELELFLTFLSKLNSDRLIRVGCLIFF